MATWPIYYINIFQTLGAQIVQGDKLTHLVHDVHSFSVPSFSSNFPPLYPIANTLSPSPGGTIITNYYNYYYKYYLTLSSSMVVKDPLALNFCHTEALDWWTVWLMGRLIEEWCFTWGGAKTLSNLYNEICISFPVQCYPEGSVCF